MGAVGGVLLWAALATTVLTAVAPRRARWAATVGSALNVGAAACLAMLLWRLDLSYSYVADHARRGVSAPYRIAGLWGGADGSLLLLAASLSLVVAVIARRPGLEVATRAGAGTVAVLTAQLVWFADPFARLQIPAISGAGLQPILEHPAMLYHPPILYAGLVACFVPWALATCSWPEESWRAATRQALATAFALLTLGQLAGANWAYVELGWGGYWGWDPVENGVLVTWLLLLAALHALAAGAPARWVAALAAAPWLSVLIGVAVTRTGVGGSIHAFADDGRSGPVLGVLFAVTGALTVARVRRRGGGPAPLVLATVGAALFAVAAAIVLEGVLFPIPAPGEPLVTGHFYATAIAPLAVVGVALGAAALGRVRPLWWAASVPLATGVGALLGARSPFALAIAGALGPVLSSSCASLVTAVRGGARRPGAPVLLGHVGVALLLVGVAGSTQADRATVTLRPGDTVTVGSVELRHLGVTVDDAPAAGTRAVVAELQVAAGPARLMPSLVAFEDRDVLLAEAALRSRPARDVQVVLRSATDGGVASYDVSVTPLVQPVWWGAVLMTAAGVAAALQSSRWRAARRRSSSASIVADSALADSASSA